MYTTILSTREQVAEAYRNGFVLQEDYNHYLKIQEKNNEIIKSVQSQPLSSFEMQQELQSIDKFFWHRKYSGGKIHFELVVMAGKPRQAIIKAKITEPLTTKVVSRDEIKKAEDTINGIIDELDFKSSNDKSHGITKGHLDAAFKIIDQLVKK